MALIFHTSSAMIDAAVRYCSLGWRLLPVSGKRPQLKDWPNTASNNPFDARRLFSRDCNIGVATGEGSGIVVLDIDPRNGGNETFAQLERELGDLPPTVKAMTGGGGVHLVFKWFDGAKSTSINGVDFLAGGKMFVVSPSIHPATGAIYEWAINPFDAAFAELPRAWQKRFSAQPLCESLFVVPVQQGARNDYLASVAGRLRASGESVQAIKNKLLEHNAQECSPPLPIDDVEAIAASISRYAVSGKSLKTQWQEAVFDSSLQTVTKLVLLALSMYADQHGKSCWPTQEDIARKANCSSRCVRDHLNRAVGAGWLRRYQRQRQGKTGFSYGYILELRPEDYSGSNG